jgi:hypothetical protein
MMAVLCIATHAGAANWSKPTFANKGQRSVIVAGCQLTLEQSLLSHQIKQSNKRPSDDICLAGLYLSSVSVPPRFASSCL